MYQIESVFIGESLLNCNISPETKTKLKSRHENIVGDIIRVASNQYKFNCIRCAKAFEHFTQFTLHIEDHFMGTAGLSLQNTIIKDEQFMQSDIKFDETILPMELISESPFDIESELSQNISSNIIIKVDRENGGPSQEITSKYINCMTKSDSKTHMGVHETDKQIFCPICMKGFNTIHYAQKHIKSIHKQSISMNDIRKAQNTLKQIVRPKKYEHDSTSQLGPDAPNTVIVSDHMSNVTLNALSSNYWRCEGKQYHCLMCVKWFTLPKYVQKHIRLVHGRQMSIDEILAAQIQGELKPDQLKTVEIVQQHQIASLQRQQAIADIAKRTKSFECFVCHTMFVSLKALNFHFPLHEGVQYACPFCAKYFSMRKYVRDHMIYRHGFDKRSKLPPLRRRKIKDFVYHKPIVSRFECYICHRTYPTRSKLKSHWKTHTEIINCSICAKIFKSHESRQRHIQLHLADPNRLHRCVICNKTFTVRRYLMSHMRSSHSKLEAETIRALPEKISLSSSPIQRQQSQSQIQTCEICFKVFDKLGKFNKHMKCHNKEPTRYICDYCGYEFNDHHLLRKHLSTVHKINKKHFKCNLCQKNIPKKREAEHFKWHRGEKEHQCEICGNQYTTVGLLNTHKKRQHAEQKFECDVCFVAFDQPRKLLHHRRIHSEPMKIHCRYCQLGFFNAKSLNKHEMAKHLDHLDYTFADCDSDVDTDTLKIENSF